MILRRGDMIGPANDPFDPADKSTGMEREIVIWTDPDMDLVALFSSRQSLYSKNGGWPWLENLSDVLERVEREEMILESATRLEPQWLGRKLEVKEREKRDAKMEVIRPLVEACPDIFDNKARGKLIGKAARKTGRTRNTIKKWLLRYFLNGVCPNGLLDRYDLCGHRRPGDTKEGWKKMGAPRMKEGKQPENVTPKLKKQFAAATDREVKFTGETFKIVGAYERWKEEFCHVEVEIDGRRETRLADRYETMAPATCEQFRYWYGSDKRHEKTRRKVLGLPTYEKDNRAITSTSTNETWGICARYQIDATVVNFGVTSKINKNILLGRPYLYFVRDVASRMIVGYYLGLLPPSQITASLALLSAFTPKDEVLKEFGLDPEVDRWPAHYLCDILLHDGGELTGHWGDWLVGKENITFEQASGERGDLKGAVESIFHWSDVEWARSTGGRVAKPGYKSPAQRNADLVAMERGELDTIWEFEKKIVEFCVDFNNHHVLKNYDPDPAMFAAGIVHVPLAMFEWGLHNNGAPRTRDPETVRRNLMPRYDVRIYKDGIHFEKRVFTAPDLHANQAEANRTGKTIPTQVSTDLSGNRVFWHGDDGSQFIECKLADRDRALTGLRFEDGNAIAAEREIDERAIKVEADRRRAQKAAERKRAKKKKKSAASKSSKTIGEIKAANAAGRRNEREAERENAFVKHAMQPAAAKPGGATIHQLPVPEKTIYTTPSLDDFDEE